MFLLILICVLITMLSIYGYFFMRDNFTEGDTKLFFLVALIISLIFFMAYRIIQIIPKLWFYLEKIF